MGQPDHLSQKPSQDSPEQKPYHLEKQDEKARLENLKSIRDSETALKALQLFGSKSVKINPYSMKNNIKDGFTRAYGFETRSSITRYNEFLAGTINIIKSNDHDVFFREQRKIITPEVEGEMEKIGAENLANLDAAIKATAEEIKKQGKKTDDNLFYQDLVRTRQTLFNAIHSNVKDIGSFSN